MRHDKTVSDRSLKNTNAAFPNEIKEITMGARAKTKDQTR